MSQLELIATASFGLEAVVARELKQLGYEDQTVEDGRVTFVADEAAVCRANLWLRSADRVLLKLGEFEARDFGTLFDRTNDLPWADWLPENAEFPVRGKSVRSQLTSVPDCQSIVKKAIVEKLKQQYKREWFDENGPKCAIEVSLLKDRATLTLDTTGPGLHKRGYRTLSGAAPLKETLAAGLVQLSFWNRERPLIDPFCGTGTIPIEAALIGRNIAPGLHREFAAEQWPRIPKQLWTEARSEAHDLATGELAVPILATDIDSEVLSLARYHAKQAGVENDIHFQQKPFSELTTKKKFGCVICNPPYGERMGEEQEAVAIYREMGNVFSPLETWSLYVLASNSQFEKLIGRKADRRRKLYNGRIECTYYQFYGPPPPR
ncbi:MAG: class I SAM-dependent RNA methyltransferase [Planctomycetes bacterium]|nr:class I SAM-dependent RNA methyltransferase [Planctomycetota bacterium]